MSVTIQAKLMSREKNVRIEERNFILSNHNSLGNYATRQERNQVVATYSKVQGRPKKKSDQ